jgi:PAS domain S-box-containing protein
MTERTGVDSPRTEAHSDVSAREQFRAIAELGDEVAWIIDCASATLSYISPSIETLLGYTADDVRRQLASDGADGPLSALCAGLAARLQRFAAGDASRGQLLRQFELTHRDGRLVPIEVRSRLLVDAHGGASALVGSVRDLGALRAQEAAQRRFASMLNHEFRTPLSSIDGAIQRLEAGAAQVDEATRGRYRRIGVAVERLIALLDEHLSPERMEQIGAPRVARGIDPRRLLDEGAALVRAAGRAVTLEVGALPATLRCDPQGLRLAFKVLIQNALDHAPATSAIAVCGGVAEGGIELLVRDGGAGVAPDETERIFAKGYRGRDAGTRAGSGLGLYMARAVVEVHGGSIGMRNLAGGGAEFRIWLPTATPPLHLTAPGSIIALEQPAETPEPAPPGKDASDNKNMSKP